MSTIPIHSYPIVLRVVKGYVEASQPDLGIYRVRGKFSDLKRREELGAIILDIWEEIANMTARGDTAGKSPSQPKDIDRRSTPEAMSTSEVATILGVSQETVRRMCKSGRLQCFKTPGGHQKILMSDPLLSRFSLPHGN